MAIIVKPIDELFKIVITEGEETIAFFIKQLTYKTKAHITGLTTTVSQGQVSIDSSLTCFFNLKYGLKKVEGITDEEGKPYKLEFESNSEDALTDKCADELLAVSFSDKLIFAAQNLSLACYPTEVLHPITNRPIKGIEIVPASEMKGTTKK